MADSNSGPQYCWQHYVSENMQWNHRQWKPRPAGL